jgi:hypothetical protein
MCDYCNEKIAIEVADTETSGRSWNPELENMAFFKVIHLQETKDFIAGFQSIKPTLERSRLIVPVKKDFRVSWGHITCLQVVLCRVLDSLVNDGFDSETYLSCIVDETLLDIIRIQYQRSKDEPLLADLAELRDIFAPGVLSDKMELAEILSADSSFVSDCKVFFRRYIEWREREETDEIDDSYNAFFNIYPYAFLSMTIVLKYFPGEKGVMRLIQNAAKVGRLFEGLDLWLQRKASVSLHEQSGLTPFLPYDEKVRPVLIYYLLVKGLLNSDEKRRLKDLVSEYLEKRELEARERYAQLPEEQRKKLEKLFQKATDVSPISKDEHLAERKRMAVYIAVHELILAHE